MIADLQQLIATCVCTEHKEHIQYQVQPGTCLSSFRHACMQEHVSVMQSGHTQGSGIAFLLSITVRLGIKSHMCKTARHLHRTGQFVPQSVCKASTLLSPGKQLQQTLHL